MQVWLGVIAASSECMASLLALALAHTRPLTPRLSHGHGSFVTRSLQFCENGHVGFVTRSSDDSTVKFEQI